jgi:hypothetical protein
MGKMFGILVIVVALWAGGQIYTQGAANAFGGILVTLGLEEPEPDPEKQQSVGRRAGSKVARSHSEADARRTRMLSE